MTTTEQAKWNKELIYHAFRFFSKQNMASYDDMDLPADAECPDYHKPEHMAMVAAAPDYHENAGGVAELLQLLLVRTCAGNRWADAVVHDACVRVLAKHQDARDKATGATP